MSDYCGGLVTHSSGNLGSYSGCRILDDLFGCVGTIFRSSTYQWSSDTVIKYDIINSRVEY